MHQNIPITKKECRFFIVEFHVFVSRRLGGDVSVFTEERIAVLLAPQWIEKNRPHNAIIRSHRKHYTGYKE